MWGVPITVKTCFLGIIQLLLPVSMCRMGYTLELTFGDWILRVLIIFTFALVLLLLLVDTTISSTSNQAPGCRIQITPAERKVASVFQKQSKASSTITAEDSSYNKLVSFAKGTKFFRLPRPKSKRQLLREQQELQEQQQRDPSQTSDKPNYPTLAGMTPPPRPKEYAGEVETSSSPDWKRAHRLLQRAASFRDDPPPAQKHGSSDEREDVEVVDRREVREDPLSKNLFDEQDCDGFDADSERDDDDTGDDSFSATEQERSMTEMEVDDDTPLFQHEDSLLYTSCSKGMGSDVLGMIGNDEEDSMILFEDDTDDDTYEQRAIRLGTHSCYSPLRSSSESEDTVEDELEDALVETLEHLSPTSSRLCI